MVNFMIGTFESDGDSEGYWEGEWCVNCLNMWKATLGYELNPINAITQHVKIILHELTHAMSGSEWCKDSWDEILEELLKTTMEE